MNTDICRWFAVTAVTLLLTAVAVSVEAASSGQKAEAEQARLDQACQDAREKILSVERAQLVEECVADQFPRSDRAGCERFFADHGNAAGGRAPLYMNLPECVAAHDFRQNTR
jgi:hypothetical protein